MQANDYVRHLRLMPVVRGLGPQQRCLWEEALLMGWIWHQPFSSPGDLVAHGVLAQARTYELLTGLCGAGFLDSAHLGSTKQQQARYFLTLKGVNFVRQRFGFPLEWQVTLEGLERLSRYLAFLEHAHELAPRLWRSTAAIPLDYPVSPDPAAARVTFGRRARMYRFVWVRKGPVHAVAQYVNDQGEELDVPFIWYGTQHGPMVMDGLESVFRGLEDPGPPGHHRRPTRPPGVVVICADRLAALRVQREFARGIPKAVVTVDRELVEVLDPVPQDGRLRLAEHPLGRVRPPDGILQWLEKNLQGRALNGVERTRIFNRIEHYPASRVTQLARGVGLRNSVVRAAVGPMIECDLVRELDDGFYPGAAGLLFISRRDRISVKTVNSRFKGYLNEDGRYREQQSRHDRGSARLDIMFDKWGMLAFTGRRMIMNYLGITQLKPDLWVLIPLGDDIGMFAAVELEYSAKTREAVNRKLLPYRLAQSAAGEPCPLYVVTGTAEAADLFAMLGDDLPMLAASQEELEKAGPDDPVWRWRGQRVPAIHLATLLRRDDFIQPTGRLVQYRPPGLFHGA